VLEIVNVTAGYDATTVLREVSVSVPDGKVVALLGANGGGKTTLLRVASRMIGTDAGALQLDGVDMSTASPSRMARAGVCHVPEGRGIFPSLTVRENLALFAGKSSAGAALDRTAKEFPVLGQRLKQVAGTLSGGEQQMLALSRTFIGTPKVILLDEVSLGLAPKVVDELFEFLTKLAASGVSLLLVEQYVDRALAMADYVYLMGRGRVEYEGAPGGLDVARVKQSYVGMDLKRHGTIPPR
jgi:branched-chain amino acid transport system ATP-binding protein